MDIVKRLRGHAKSNAGGARELLVLSADEIERLRLSLMTFADNVKETNAGIDKNWAETVNSLKANNERLRQQNADLVEVIKITLNACGGVIVLPEHSDDGEGHEWCFFCGSDYDALHDDDCIVPKLQAAIAKATGGE